MIVLAVLLLVLAAAVVVFVVLTGTTETASLVYEPLNVAWEPSVLVVFLAGAAVLFLVELALALMRGGTRRRLEQRRELKRLRKRDSEQARTADRTTAADDRAATVGTAPDRGTRERPGSDRPGGEPVDTHGEHRGPGPAGGGTTRTDPPTRSAPVSPPPEGENRRS